MNEIGRWKCDEKNINEYTNSLGIDNYIDIDEI